MILQVDFTILLVITVACDSGGGNNPSSCIGIGNSIKWDTGPIEEILVLFST